MKEPPTEEACTRCGASTKGKLDGVALCDTCYSVFGACCASEFESDDLLCKPAKPSAEKKDTLADSGMDRSPCRESIKLTKGGLH